MSIRMSGLPEKVVELATNVAARAEWEQAIRDELDITLEAARSRRMSGEDSPGLKEIRARIDAAQEAMADSVRVFTLRALPRGSYRNLVAAHPPRDGVREDEVQRINVATFGDALIASSIVGVTHKGEPVDFDPEADWGPLADEMTDAQWSEFYECAVALNKRVPMVPPKRAS